MLKRFWRNFPEFSGEYVSRATINALALPHGKANIRKQYLGKRLGSGTLDMNQTKIDWGTTLELHRGWLSTVIRSRLADRDAAADVMQEVALAAVRQANPPSDPEKIAPWLYRIALRKVINHHRAKGRGKQLVQGVIEKGEVRSSDREPAPGAWLLDQEDQASLASGLAKLSAQDRQILLLKYTEGWGYEALARHLGITVKTVEYRLLKARRALRAQLSAIE